MLVLTRRINESIVIPGLGITVRVLAIRGNSVRFGVEARGCATGRDCA